MIQRNFAFLTISVNTKIVVEQAKILRVFKLIGLLKSRPRTIEILAEELETTSRTIYRYIKLLEELGFIIDKDWHNQYFIHKTQEEEDKNLFFTEVEAVLMKELISSSLAHHPLKESLQKKLFLHSDLKGIPEQLFKARLGKLVEQIVNAIDHKSQVILKSYHSGHSGIIRDRLIEPFDFGSSYETVIAFEPESGQNKHYKIERIGDVVELEKEWQCEKKHEKPSSDIFGISGEDSIEIRLSMTLKAYLLLREEYPKSIPFLQKSEEEENKYIFIGPVNGLKGIGRFVMGLMNEITIISPDDLNVYINDIYSQYRHKT